MKNTESYSSKRVKKQLSRYKLLAILPTVVLALLGITIYVSNTIHKKTNALTGSWDFSSITSTGNASGKDITAFTTLKEAALGRLSFVNSPVAPGHSLSARVETHDGDTPSGVACCRAEFMDWNRAGSAANQVGTVVPNSDYYYSFSYYLPTNFTSVPNGILPGPGGGAHYHLHQFHAYANAKGYGPDLSIELTPGVSGWRVNYLNKSKDGSTTLNYASDISHITLSNSYNVGRWTNIILHYNPTTGIGTSTGTPKLEVWYWLDGEAVPTQPVASVKAYMRHDGSNNISQALQHGMYRASGDGAGTMVHYTEGFIRSSNFTDALKFYSGTSTGGSIGGGTGGTTTGGGATNGGSPSGSTSTGDSTTTSGQAPYLNAISIPGKLEVENYDKGGEGVAYHDTDTANKGGKYRTDGVDLEDNKEGGYSIGYVAPGEWTTYTTNIAETGKYDITFRVATTSTTNSSWTLKQGNNIIATASTTNTGGWYSWKDMIVKDVNLTAGNNQVLKLEASGNSLNINSVNFVKQGSSATSGGQTSNTSSGSGSASLPATPTPPIQIPNANPTTPVEIPKDLPMQDDGTLIADFNGDGLNDVAKDTNSDNKIDPKTEIIIDGKDNKELTDTTKASITTKEYNKMFNADDSVGTATPINNDTITIKAGPLPEAKVSKKVAYGFVAYEGIGAVSLGGYLAMAKLGVLAAVKRRFFGI